VETANSGIFHHKTCAWKGKKYSLQFWCDAESGTAAVSDVKKGQARIDAALCCVVRERGWELDCRERGKF
jgi:hypothetical protein